MKYRLDPTAPQGISRDEDKIIPYFQDRIGKPSLIDSVNGKHGAVQIVGGSNVTVDNSGPSIVVSASGSGGGGAVDSVNGQTGTVVLDADDIDDTSTTNKFVTASDLTTLSNTSGTNTGDQDLSGYLLSATAASTYEPIKGADDNYVTDAEKVVLSNTSGTNTGDQDLSSLALKSNVLELDNTDAFTPTADYHPATKKYVDDSVTSGGGYTDEQAQDAVGTILTDSTEIDFTYNDATPSITAAIKSGSIDETKLDASVNASLDLADTSIQNLAGLGVTATASELNALDGITATVTELNYTDGVTSAIQTQLDGKQPLDADLTTLAAAGNSSVLAATTASFLTADETKLDGIEALADVTDATNVAAAGAVMESDTSTASMSFVIDEDDMASDSATKVPTQQSVKAYVDANTGGGGSGDVTGPSSSTDNAIAVYDDDTGRLLRDSGIIHSLVGSENTLTSTVSGFGADLELVSNTLTLTTNYGGTATFDDTGLRSNTGVYTNTVGELTADTGVTVDGVLIKDGEVDGRDVSADGSKLDGIESGADVTDSTNVQAALPSGSNGQVLKHNGTSWAAGTDNNTTYSEISEANIENTSSSTAGLITGRRAEALMDNEASKARTLTNKTLTAPRLASGGYIADANGNELIKAPTTVASAVNEVTVSNAATGNNPSITATGGDTNISLNLVSKGSGAVLANGVQVADLTSSQTLLGKSISGVTNTITEIGNFSTSETSTGNYWVDGKLIYKKTVSFGTLPNATSKNVAHGISPDYVLEIYGSAKSSTGTVIPLPFSSTAATSNISLNSDSTNITVSSGIDRTAFTTCYVTMFYTK